MTIKVGDQCIRRDAPWTAVDLFIVERVSGTGFDVSALRRNGAFLDERSTISKETPLFKYPYGSKAAFTTRVDPAISRRARRVRWLAQHWIIRRSRPTLGQLIGFLETSLPEQDSDFLMGCLKCSISIGSITVAGEVDAEPDQLTVSVSKDAYRVDRLAEFAASFGDEIEAQAKRFGLVIGHAPTVGTHREELLRALLQKYLPERYHVATGFISGYERQLDILIYDRIDYAPLLREGNLVVVHISAVRATIEVKSTLTQAELRRGLEILQPLDSLSGPPIFKGIFAYTSKMSTTAIIDAMIRYYDDKNEDLDTYAALSGLREIVTAVCVQKRSLILSDFREIEIRPQRQIIVPSLISVKSATDRTPEAALFLDRLIQHIRGVRAATGQELAPFMQFELERGEAKNVYDDIWGPYLSDDGDIDSQVRSEANAIKRWRRGERWGEPDER
jgi:hypothetical protein